MDKPDRQQILESAIKHTCGDRNKQYGDPWENFSNTADLFTAYIIAKYRGCEIDENRFSLTPEDAAHLMILVKMARTFTGKVKQDTYEDMAAYSAIAGELAIMAHDMQFTRHDTDFTPEEVEAMLSHSETRT